MSKILEIKFDYSAYKGNILVPTGLFIGGQFVEPAELGTIDVINPATGQSIGAVSIGTSKDVDVAVSAAKKAFKTSWGPRTPGQERGKMLYKLAELMTQHLSELAALEAIDVGKPFAVAKITILGAIDVIRYFAGWADKVHGSTIETDESKFCYTRREPYGVVGAIIPWNVPTTIMACKLAPALATGNTVVLKPSEITPLTALFTASLINDAGFPSGVVNIVNGYGHTVGQAMSEHNDIMKIAFTGSTMVGRKIQEASARTNLKVLSMELGGKSPNIIFDDANLEQAVKWARRGIFYISGEFCMAGSRIFVQEGIYDAFLDAFSKEAMGLQAATGNPLETFTQHGPLISQTHFNRVMGYIDSGKAEGGKVLVGGERHGTEGYFVQPTIFTDCHRDMKIVREEIFGPVAVVTKFKTEEEVIELANDTAYGLACGIFTENVSRAIRISNSLEAGTAYVNCYPSGFPNVPFGGYKQSGYGRDMGQEALEGYTQVKAVHINVGTKI